MVLGRIGYKEFSQASLMIGTQETLVEVNAAMPQDEKWRVLGAREADKSCSTYNSNDGESGYWPSERRCNAMPNRHFLFEVSL
jgi:hypothetical protein